MVLSKQDLPKQLFVNNKEYNINTDFRTWINFELILTDSQIDQNTKILTIIEIILIDEIIASEIKSIFEALFSFYFIGQDYKNDTKKETSEEAYNFQVDWKYIYPAFMQQYNIDLFEANLHWWQFKALFDSLHEDTQFIKVVGYRTMKLEKIRDRDQRAIYSKLKKQYAIKRNNESKRSAKEIEAEIMASMKGGV